MRRRAAALTALPRTRRGGAGSVLLSLVTLTLTGSAATAAGAQPRGAEESLAVVNAAGGSFTETAEGYRLILENVTPRAVWFADRPERGTGSYSIAELDEVFFADDEPPSSRSRHAPSR